MDSVVPNVTLDDAVVCSTEAEVPMREYRVDPGPWPAAHALGVTDITGWRVGDLRIIARVGTDERGRTWLCECSGCGQRLHRLTTTLSTQLRRGAWPACTTCMAEERAGRRALQRDINTRGWYLDLWEMTGSLYRHNPEELKDYADVSLSSERWDPLECDKHGGQPRIRRDWFTSLTQLVPCTVCGVQTRSGCLWCLDALCVVCRDRHFGCQVDLPEDPGDRERHERWIWGTAGGLKLHEAGQVAWGPGRTVNREQVRQTEARGLRKLRHTSRRKYLRSFAWTPADAEQAQKADGRVPAVYEPDPYWLRRLGADPGLGPAYRRALAASQLRGPELSFALGHGFTPLHYVATVRPHHEEAARRARIAARAASRTDEDLDEDDYYAGYCP